MSMEQTSCLDAYNTATTSWFGWGFGHDGKDARFESRKCPPLKYQPLPDPSKDIRLVYLMPKSRRALLDGQSTIRCQLITYTAGSRTPPYVCLSYTWGDPKLRRPILVGSCVAQVTDNLAIALEHLQHVDKTLILWIDALCIDQADNNEKSKQVQKMASIYRNAAVVIAWLGRETPLTKEAIDYCLLLDRAGGIGAISTSEWPDRIIDDNHDTLRHAPMPAILELARRPWFSRVWVLQEFVVNRHCAFLSGSKYIDKRVIILGIFFCLGFTHELDVLFAQSFHRAFGGVLRFTTGTTNPLDLDEENDTHAIYGLLSGASLEASDPRDFVYSYSSLLSDAFRQRVAIDYTRPVGEVYTDLAAAITSTTEDSDGWNWQRGMSSSRYVSLGRARYDFQLPSWVPDWSNTSMLRASEGAFMDDRPAIYDGAKIVQVSSGQRLMQTRVRWTDKVCLARNMAEGSLLDALSSPFELETAGPAALRLVSFIQETVEIIGNARESLDKTVFELSLCDNVAQNLPSKRLYKSYRSLRKAASSGSESDLTNSQYYVGRLCTSELGVSCIFQTEGNRIGSCFCPVYPGDQITASGWILRPDGDGTYKIISPAFLLHDTDPEEYPESIKSETEDESSANDGSTNSDGGDSLENDQPEDGWSDEDGSEDGTISEDDDSAENSASSSGSSSGGSEEGILEDDDSVENSESDSSSSSDDSSEGDGEWETIYIS